MNKAQLLNARIESVETTALNLQQAAEQWTLVNPTFWDLRIRRQALLEAARRYGAAVRNLARPA